ncbi:hypothetical protein CV016_12605 [Yersinia kristensenii]|nr:hypothetical protein CV016_12605 [Yersinia kristensenii]
MLHMVGNKICFSPTAKMYSTGFENLTINDLVSGNGGVNDNAEGSVFRNICDEIAQKYIPQHVRVNMMVTASPLTFTNAYHGYESVLINEGNVILISFKQDTAPSTTGITSELYNIGSRRSISCILQRFSCVERNPNE